MKTTIHPSFIYRVPKFHCGADLYQYWPELKEAIQFSSPDFYELIKDIAMDKIGDAPPQVQATLWKYFNRARFRATPYGTFAAFGCLRLNGYGASDILKIGRPVTLHRFTDWSHKSDHLPASDDVLRSDFKLFANSSYYRIGNSIRYIYFDTHGFQLSEIEYNERLEQILQRCIAPVKISKLLNKSNDLECMLADIYFLLSEQLLLHSAHPSIIGEDYFKRLGKRTAPQNNDYIIAERKPLSSGISSNAFRHIPALVELLHKITPAIENPGLENFIARFSRKFEQNEVPLMLALDPECGIGYDDLETAAGADGLVAELLGSKGEIANGQLAEKMMQAMLNDHKSDRMSINLEELGTALPFPSNPLPNTLSLLCQVYEDAVLVENIGGVTANALNGRFSLASEEVHSLCRELAAVEQQANPDVLLFDIGYIAEGQVDNINRRKAIYSLELNLLCYDTSAKPLTLGDIFVAVRGGELILFSPKYGKRLIPRLSTAYNYQRSDLPVFRLLCDLQRQGLKANLNFSLTALVPGLDFYPEVRYRNIIVSPRKWRLKIGTVSDGPSQLKDFLPAKVSARYVRSGIGDQTLSYDLNDDTSLMMLWQLLRKEKELMIEEMPMPEKNIVKDQDGKPYLGQLQLNIVHDQNIYKPYFRPAKEKGSDMLPTIFPPGGPWLYYEIFCHPQRGDELLLDKLSRFLSAFERQIKTWFFIRYNDGGHHLRLRIKLHEATIGHQLTARLSDMLREELENGLVADLRLNLYRREIARYGADQIEAIEEHFSKDSIFVMILLSQSPDNFVKYHFCINLMELAASAGLFALQQFNETIRRQSNAFNQEHRLTPEDFKKLNTAYKQYRSTSLPAFDPWIIKVRKRFEASLIAILEGCPPAGRDVLLCDLMHMHINRLFADHQRVHEMIIYYYLVKELQRRKALLSTD